MENSECVTMAIQNTEEPKAHQTKLKHDPLIHVIQKLSAVVENDKPSRCFEGRKRSHPDKEMQLDIHESCASPSISDLDIHPKRIKAEAVIDHSHADLFLPRERKAMFYQCSLCNFLSHSFETLKIHVKNHGQQNEIILMCSECHITFKKHEDLEGHIKKHCETEDTLHPQQCKQLSTSPDFPEKVRKKWYAHEDYGLYRCLICKYTCGQQRMLKTHAWKHAGEVDCSYPIFEEENESAGLPDSTVAHSPHGSESVLSEDTESRPNSQTPDKVQVCDSLLLENTVKNTETINSTTNPETIEVVVVDDSLSDADQDNMITNSLLSSAQKIISCSQNKKGHVNVIVERLPSAEETVSQKALLISNDLAVKKKIVPRDSQIVCEGSVEVYHADKNVVENEEIIIGWSNTIKTGDFHESNENFPPVRRRTNSECLRLHSLAAEALVTMPISVVECPKSSLRILSKPDSLDPDTGQQEGDRNFATYSKIVSSKMPEKVDGCGQTVINLKESQEGSELKEAPIKMGISMSLLKVIEKLRERTDQNATDDDILKELRDNAQTESTVDFASSSNVVEYLPHAERPYRCRLCHYSSDNKGYIKQHLRVHRQRQPYQCPICEHIADNSSDLENHMINHCKTRMYECKHCAESFYYKAQLRNHEREHRSHPDNRTLSTSSDEQHGSSGDNEDKQPSEGSKSCNPKLYRCDVCSYTSSTYVGVRNHRRIHTCDKPYRCQVCNFATTNMSSLKCHMRRHPEEHQAVQLVEQYKCSLCGYVCSHPPSLKSHMWKHASDQNYNYEQVNKAINEAMSQSSRIQGETIKKSLSEDSDRVHVNSESSIRQSAYGVKNYIESPKVNQTQITLCNTEKLQSQIRPEAELCVLLFCCCICGFESTSKELLMEHMKAHEGEIINIILNKSESAS
ncbi:hypothetical protein XENTR_v10011680 [Xenopus tropicalis]|uniref:Zinc finger protein 507 n=2 Tax=Xenopus tropicalis TaxID=8364 RepID=A0A6I8PLE2_XENTR|nr:zinc finger protein 507 isoform X1 [Xenopus tropicalis]XP_012817723.1 zinc finger protein 507 isoform X1 [Xenopus tropicalis]KAE8608982.1 hypothetical protein XENTR_v10011680 [Xenopus tropicalis]|eukprot:XP_012817723.1 PREDICTED: zinc finger protein 507 isoform X1 [Xenopus tropicalis]